MSEKHAGVARASLAKAGVADRAEVRVGAGSELLPVLEGEPPFDLVFIDADKPGYPTYLDWALKLTRPGSIIVADNCIRGGAPLRENPPNEDARALGEYDRRVASDSRLLLSPSRWMTMAWTASPSPSCADSGCECPRRRTWWRNAQGAGSTASVHKKRPRPQIGAAVIQK